MRPLEVVTSFTQVTFEGSIVEDDAVLVNGDTHSTIAVKTRRTNDDGHAHVVI